jgi:hypothetical protein
MAALVSLALSLTACSRGGGGEVGRAPEATASERSQAAGHGGCGNPTRLEEVSPEVAPGVPAGPIWFIVGGRVGRPAAVMLEPNYPDALYPRKVLIFLREPLTAPVTLRGWRCSDGKPLRFWYRGGPVPLPSNPASAKNMATAGDLVSKLEATEPPIVSPTLGYPGYILFSAPGRWIVIVEQDGEAVGSSVFRVLA